MKNTAQQQKIYTGLLIGLTLANAIMLYRFSMYLAISRGAYFIYFTLSTIAAFYLIFSIKKRKALWWLLLLLYIYLAIHAGIVCLLAFLLRGAYFGG